jgi:hypothetical protein
MQNLKPVITKNFVHQPSSVAISVFCKRVGNICATCNNRARHSHNGETFTNLQLCQACESFLFPKISSTRLRKFFDISPNAEYKIQRSETLNSFRQAIQKPRRQAIFRWSDVEELIRDGSLTLNPIEFHDNKLYGRRLSSEEYSIFSADGGDLVTWSHREELFIGHLWWDSVIHWAHELCYRFHAIDVELILFKEFRYQFDSSWPPTRNKEDDIKVYSSFARYWATTQLVWKERPWRLQNFPLPPRCSISNPYTDEDDLREDEFDLAEYQHQCSKFRAIIKAFPDVLRSPKTWIRCLSRRRKRKSISEVIQIALSAAQVWEESNATEIGFEIRPQSRKTPWLDIAFVRKEKDIKPTILPLRFPVWGDIRRGSIIRINGDSVELISPVTTVTTVNPVLLTTEEKVLDANEAR